MKKVLRISLKIVGWAVLLFGGFLGYLTITDYRPKPVERLTIENPNQLKIETDTFTLLSWNIGYAGLGAKNDFFFDGGKDMRPSKENFEEYLSGIANTLNNADSIDFILIQEVDINSKRSYFTNEVNAIVPGLENHAYSTAINYNSKFVPRPLLTPYGKTYGGLISFSKYAPSSSTRFALADDASWPMSLFFLKRCFQEFRYPLANGKELVVINQHLSAYDDGTVKQEQMDTLAKKLLKEYELGNYVVVGGDWNQFPPHYKPSEPTSEKSVEENYPAQGWTWAADLNKSSNRKLDAPYVKGKTIEVVIDYFLLSPNIQLLEVKGVDKGFAFSDHEPVFVKLALRN